MFGDFPQFRFPAAHGILVPLQFVAGVLGACLVFDQEHVPRVFILDTCEYVNASVLLVNLRMPDGSGQIHAVLAEQRLDERASKVSERLLGFIGDLHR